MYKDIIKIDNNEGTFVFKISKKVVDELYAMHGIVVSDGVLEMIDYELNEHIQSNLKNDKDYYNKLGMKIIEKDMREIRKKNEKI